MSFFTDIIENCQLILKSGYFDKKYFSKSYKNVFNKKNSPILLYTVYQYISNKLLYKICPSSKFDANLYISIYPDTSDVNPLLHYIKYGKNEGRLAFYTNELPHDNVDDLRLILSSSLFNYEWYISHNNISKDIRKEKVFVDFITNPDFFCKNPSSLFDSELYLALYQDVKGMNPLIHFIKYGRNEGRLAFYTNELPHDKVDDLRLILASSLFNYEWYISHNNIDKNSRKEKVFVDFITNPDFFCKNPSSLFDSELYLALYQDVKGMNPLIHFIKYGRNEGRLAFYTNELPHDKVDDLRLILASSLFNYEWYISHNNIDKNSRKEKVFVDFLLNSKFFTKNPSSLFDAVAYLNNNPDIISAKINPLLHFIKHGKIEKRKNITVADDYSNDLFIIENSKFFDKNYYVNHYSKFLGKLSAAEHYLSIGWKEHCSPSDNFNNDLYAEYYNIQGNPLLEFEKVGKFENQMVGVNTLFTNNIEQNLSQSLVFYSEYFDQDYYYNQLKLYNKKDRLSLDKNLQYYDRNEMISHYLDVGWKLGIDPSPSFSTTYYLNTNTDVKNADMCPLVHFLKYGIKEKRDYSGVATKKLKLFEDKILRSKTSCPDSKLSSKTILVVSHELSYTGAPISLLDNVILLRELGYNIFIISLKDGKFSNELVANKFEFLITDNIKDIKCLAMLCDIVICNTIVTYKIVREVQNIIPTIWWLREDPKQFIESCNSIKIVISSCPNCYTMSDFSKQQYLSYNEQIKVIKHGLKDCFNGIFKPKNKIVKMAILGSIEQRKGQDILVDAFLLLNDKEKTNIEIYIIGNSLDENFVNNILEKTKNYPQIKILPLIKDKKELYEFISSTDAIVVPSRTEPTSRVAIEATMLGKPLILSDQVGAQYLLNTPQLQNFIFKNHDPKQLCCLLKYFISISNNNYLDLCKIIRKQYELNNSFAVLKTNLGKMIREAQTCRL